MVGHRHIPYLSFHKEVIREICRPQKDDLLIMAKGLGMRRVICALLKTYDRKEDLVLVVNATPQDEAGIGDELGIMGVRDPGFRIMTYEMSVQQREEMYRHGGLFSVTSKILINDFLKGNVPVKLITGLVILHAEKVHHGSQEEFAVRLYRRENQSGFCKAFSDEPETFAHGLSPMKDMLVNLNMNNVMVWPRYNEAVKASLTTRKAEVAELYQPMTEAMRACQDAVTGCMEAMLVELKRDHSLNLDLDDLNVRNAQFKSFDTIVRMRLKPVWNKVGTKTKIHVASLTELRNLQTWLLEYDSATFASYVNTLQRQHFHAQKTAVGPGKHVHDWFNAKAATMLVEASQARVSRKRVVMDNETEDPDDPNSGWHSTRDDDRETSNGDARQFEDDEAAMRDMDGEAGPSTSTRKNGHGPQSARELREEEEDEDVMEAIATQSAAFAPPPDGSRMDLDGDGDSDDELRAVDGEDGGQRGSGEAGEEGERIRMARPPPVFRAVNFDQDEVLRRSVAKRLKKGHEPVLEELPKWSLLAKVLKEIEDTMERLKISHADQPGTNTTLIMCSSDRTVLQLRQYLTTMQKTDPPFNGEAGRRMMNTLFLSNWQHERIGSDFLSGEERGAMLQDRQPGDQARMKRDELHDKRMEGLRTVPAPPTYKRRRTRGGHLQSLAARMPKEMELEHKEAMMMAQSAFTGGSSEAVQTEWAIKESVAGSSADSPASTSASRLPPSRSATRNLVELTPSPPDAAGRSATANTQAPTAQDAFETILAQNGVLDDAEVDVPGAAPDAQRRAAWLEDRGLAPEDWTDSYGLLEPEETVIIRPYGGEDDDILLNELRPRFVVLYEPNLAFIRRLEVYKNCNPGLALRVYQMMYANSFEEDRFLSTMQREDEAFKKLIDDRSSMVIPIYNNNPRAPMRDNVSRAKTTYSSRNAGGGEQAEEPKIIVDIREMGALLPSLIDAAGIKVIPATLTVGDYILNPRMCVERKSLDDLSQSLANGRLHTQCESMTAHYEVCILLIEFEEESFGFRPKDTNARGKDDTPYKQGDSWSDFYLQSKLVLLALHFPKLRIIWSSSPHETVKILGDLKLNHDEPDEVTAVLKGSSGAPDEGRPTIENANAVEMLRAIPGVQGFKLKRVMERVESLQEFVEMSEKELQDVLGSESGTRAYQFMRRDIRGTPGVLANKAVPRRL